MFLVAPAALGARGWRGSCSSLPSSIPPRWEAGHVQLPARQRCRGSSAFWGSSGLLRAASCRFQSFWGWWEEDFQRCGATWRCQSRGCAGGELSPHSPSALALGSIAKLPPKKSSLLLESLPCLRAAVLGGTGLPRVRCQDPAFPCGTPGSQGRCGAAGGTDAASTCLHSEGGERGNFPDSFPRLKGKKKKI